jgi:hypothetical protein
MVLCYRQYPLGPVSLVYANEEVDYCLNIEALEASAISTNNALRRLQDLGSEIGFSLWDVASLRTLSAMVGHIFSHHVGESHSELMLNPNQDGQPDLIALTRMGLAYISENTNESGHLNTDKTLWSPYPFGGVEIKSTCGNTPPASEIPKPGIGDSRYPILASAEWKAHHQDTGLLLGVHWDFVDGYPVILALFFRNDLDTVTGRENRHWGVVVTPSGNSKTTSVSVMKTAGVRRMGEGLILLCDNEEIRTALNSNYHFDTHPFYHLKSGELDDVLREHNLTPRRLKIEKIIQLLIQEIRSADLENIDSLLLGRALRNRNIVPTGERLEDLRNLLSWTESNSNTPSNTHPTGI